MHPTPQPSAFTRTDNSLVLHTLYHVMTNFLKRLEDIWASAVLTVFAGSFFFELVQFFQTKLVTGSRIDEAVLKRETIKLFLQGH
mmetsp:Transcript_26015/g.42679  ORF Transcript_26015/g.42679 Transcript_26015/m.42679 type:complete len:85 (+) Transcript_26015:1986-2240(+)